MATITVRGLDEKLKSAIEKQARDNGRSMEAEVRVVLEAAVSAPKPQSGLGSRIRALFAEAGGLDLTDVQTTRDEKAEPANFD